MLLWLRASLFVVVNSMDFTSSGCDRYINLLPLFPGVMSEY
ncbi:hypothetical protein T09_5596 [Trichinella sp. T9]|nr:hypothetical protein T09_5596 [Trichinella sp. T9]